MLVPPTVSQPRAPRRVSSWRGSSISTSSGGLSGRQVLPVAVNQPVHTHRDDVIAVDLEPDPGQRCLCDALDHVALARRVVLRLVAGAEHVAAFGDELDIAAHVLAERAIGDDAVVVANPAGDLVAKVDEDARLALERILEAHRLVRLQVPELCYR